MARVLVGGGARRARHEHRAEQQRARRGPRGSEPAQKWYPQVRQNGVVITGVGVNPLSALV
jgi:hypothetical protein